VAGGLAQAVERARKIGAEALQVFPSNPRQWRRPRYAPAELADFRAALRRAGKPLAVHTIYLINLATGDAQLRERSAQALTDALVFGARCAAAGVVTHVGSHRGDGFEAALGRVAGAVRSAVARAEAAAAPEPLPPVLLETSAGGRGTVGGSPEELGRLLRELPERTGICLDTAHLFAAGYPIHVRAGLEAFWERLGRHVGRGRVGLVHLNDCKSDLGSLRDRHENLWQGAIGREGLGLWVRHPDLQEVPFVLETPGFDQQGPDRRNLRRAKELRAAPESPTGPGSAGC
jgi:deoxyribonuclease-4